MEPRSPAKPRSPFDELREEHVALLADAGDLQASLRGLTQPEAATLGGGSLIRDTLDIFQRRLRVHFRREEEGVFPEAQRMVSEGAQDADVFGRFFAQEAEDDMSAHATLASRAKEMLEMATQIEEAGGPDEASARRLLALANLTASLLERHAAKEDTLIFPMIQKSLTPAQVDAVRDRLRVLGSDRDLTTGDDSGLAQLGG
jgi:iron-sulfur cluster repair protein YtfE (RIC family)